MHTRWDKPHPKRNEAAADAPSLMVMDCTHYCPNAERIWDIHDRALAAVLHLMEQEGRLPKQHKHIAAGPICGAGLEV